MKKIKKLTLNKEVVSILGGNDMNLVKGGVYSVDECPLGNDANGTGAGGGGDPSGICLSTTGNTCNGGTFDGCPPASMTCALTCNGNCATLDPTCNTCNTCPNTCANTCGATCMTCKGMCF